MAPEVRSEGPQGNPLEGEASIPDGTGVEGPTTIGGVPNDDESAQQPEGYNPPPDAEGPASTPEGLIGTDGDVQGQARDTDDIKARRVIDPDAPFDYNQLPDDQNVQGNHYPPGPDFYKKQLADAEVALANAEAAREAAQKALDAAADDMTNNVSDVPEQPDETVEAVNDNESLR